MNRERFRQAVVDASCGCEIQHDGWPCGTCFATIDFPDDLAPHAWHAVLAYRGDYTREEGWYDPALDRFKTVVGMTWNDDGTFKEHVYAWVPAPVMRERLHRVAAALGVPDEPTEDGLSPWPFDP